MNWVSLASLAFLAASLSALRYYYKKNNVDACIWVSLADIWAAGVMVLQ